MSKFWRLTKMMALIGCGGMLWMGGTGSCLPYNFYASLLGDTFIAGIVGVVAGSIGALLPPATGT